MRLLKSLGVAVLAFLPGCAAFRSGEGVDLAALASEIETYRLDLKDIAVVAPVDSQFALLILDEQLQKVVGALNEAAAGGPIDSIQEAARAFLTLADEYVLTALPGTFSERVIFYVTAAKIVVRHLAGADLKEAQQAAKSLPSPN